MYYAENPSTMSAYSYSGMPLAQPAASGFMPNTTYAQQSSSYAQPSYAQPSYAQPSYAQQQPSSYRQQQQQAMFSYPRQTTSTTYQTVDSTNQNHNDDDDDDDETNLPSKMFIYRQPKYQCTFEFDVQVAPFENDTDWEPLDDILYNDSQEEEKGRSEDWEAVRRYNFSAVAIEAGRKYYARTKNPFFFVWAHCSEADKELRSMRFAMYVYPLPSRVLEYTPGNWQSGGQELTLGSVMKYVSRKDLPMEESKKEVLKQSLENAARLKEEMFLTLCKHPSVGPSYATQCFYPVPSHIGDFRFYRVRDSERMVSMYDCNSRKFLCVNGRKLDEHLESGQTTDQLFDDEAESLSSESYSNTYEQEEDEDSQAPLPDTLSFECAKMWVKDGGRGGDLPSVISFGDASSMNSQEFNQVMENDREQEEEDGSSQDSSESAIFSWEGESSYSKDEGGDDDEDDDSNSSSAASNDESQDLEIEEIY